MSNCYINFNKLNFLKIFKDFLIYLYPNAFKLLLGPFFLNLCLLLKKIVLLYNIKN